MDSLLKVKLHLSVWMTLPPSRTLQQPVGIASLYLKALALASAFKFQTNPSVVPALGWRCALQGVFRCFDSDV
jgi:hypothetical protein